MSDSRYAVVFNGEVLDGFAIDDVKQNLQKLFSFPIERVEQLFARSKVVIKSGLDENQASRYMDALEKAGARVHLEQVAAAAPPPPAPTPTPTPTPTTAPEQAESAAESYPEGENSMLKTVVLAPPAASEPDAAEPEGPDSTGSDQAVEMGEIREIPFEFSGQGGEYFKIWIVNLLLTLLTLGIYSAWAKVRNKRYFYGNTTLDGASFEYTAKPIAILKGRLIAAGFFVLYSVAGGIFPPLALVMFLVLLILIPWMVVRSLSFNARNSRYRNVPLRFNGRTKEAIMPFVVWPLLGVLSFGLLAPFAFYKQQQFMVTRHGYGTTNFEFTATAKDYYIIFGLLFAVLIIGGFGSQFIAMAIPPLGILLILALYLFVFIFFSVSVFNLRFNSSLLGDHSFGANMELQSYAVLVVVNTVLTVLTLGLFRPWAKVRTARYKAEHLQLLAAGDLGEFIAAEEQQVGALGEEMGEMFDFEFGL